MPLQICFSMSASAIWRKSRMHPGAIGVSPEESDGTGATLILLRLAALVPRTPGDEAGGGKAFDEGDDLDLSAPRLNFAGTDHGIYAVVAALD